MKAAEKALQTASQQHPDKVAMALLQIMRTSKNLGMRELSTVLLRKALTAKDANKTAVISDAIESQDKSIFWNKLTPQIQQTIKNELLNAITHEPDRSVRRKIGHTISELALYICASSGLWDISKAWKELLPALSQLAVAENPIHRTSALEVFAKLCLYIGDSIKIHSAGLKTILEKGLRDTASLEVRIAALTATVSFIQLLDTEEERVMYSPFIPLMFDTLNVCITQKREKEARIALEILVELVDLEPTFLRPHLSTVVKVMANIANAAHFPESMRQLGLEFLTTLAERAPGMIRKLKEYIDLVLPIVLNFMLMIPDEPDWGNVEKGSKVEISFSDIGDECLDRIAMKLGGPVIVPPLFKLIDVLLKNSDWKHRHTGLMALSLVAEGCSDYLMPHLPDIVNTFIPFFGDTHPRVRWAACNVAGQLSTDFGTAIPFRFADKVIPPVCGAMDDVNNPRVQCHAASALINFCEHATEKTLLPFLELCLKKLSGLLMNGKRPIQEQAVTAVAAIADVVKDKFLPYYGHFVPMLKNILWKATGEDFRTLRGKSMECITLIALGVGKQKFAPDAKDVLDVFLALQNSGMKDDDPQIPFLRAGWARMCNILGMDFAPYLEVALKPLIVQAAKDADLAVLDDAENTESKEGFQYIAVGSKRIAINTATMEDKAAACNMIYQYAVALKANFARFVPATSEILIPLTQFYFHDGVRAAACASLPALLESVKLNQAQTTKDRRPVIQLFEVMFQNLAEAIVSEIDVDILLLMLEVICEIINTAGPMCMSPESMRAACNIIIGQLKERSQRMQQRLEEKRTPDFDEIERKELEAENSKEDEVLIGLSELITRVMKCQKESFLPVFTKELVPSLVQMLQPNAQWQHRQLALCIFDDVVEYSGVHSLPLFNYFFQPMSNYIEDPNHDVRQAAVYGIGVCAQVAGEKFRQFVPDLVKRMSAVISHPNARKKPNIACTENAISAFGKICQYQGAAFNQDQGIELWFSFLPVQEDKIEAKVIYNQLCNFLEAKPNAIFGQNYQRLPKVLDIFTHILGTELTDPELAKRIVILLKKMKTTFPQDLLQKAAASLSPDMQKKLAMAFQS
eukprot:TRINITY_DN4861_c0_g1_i1.p1 TRINITY_DN4861_c0_g1~~TRINITY_DN4861_c0_g1_i1.p1  ORF type:complete len:1108 (-),score=211.60 TRINITY_DN4861_c0_g1_i1:685-3954(-)